MDEVDIRTGYVAFREKKTAAALTKMIIFDSIK